jgi:hypothetical protein
VVAAANAVNPAGDEIGSGMAALPMLTEPVELPALPTAKAGAAGNVTTQTVAAPATRARFRRRLVVMIEFVVVTGSPPGRVRCR